LQVGYATDRGRDRKHNEDSLFFWRSILRRAHDYMPFGLFIVADGLGGHANGESASELATHVVASRVLGEIYLPFLNETEADASPAPINEVLASAVEACNVTVCQRIPGAGTTLTAMLLMGDTAFFAHVGDSRAYLLSQGKMQQITEDHSLVGRLLEAGAISEEEALEHPQRNIIYRSVGQGENLQADWYTIEMPPDGRILLCTDGLWGSVPEQEMPQIIVTAANPQEACDRLVDVARQRGSVDDVTIILIERDRAAHAG